MRDDAPVYQQMISANAYFALARFAPPEEVLALPRPKLPIVEAAWRFARGEALYRKGDGAGVRAEAAAVRGLTGALPDDGSRQAQDLTFIIREVLAGRAAMLENRPADAAIAYRQAADLQESAEFSSVADPPAWHYPVRRDLAEALLAAGDPAGAKAEAEGALAYRVKDPGTLDLLRKMGTTAAR